MIQDYIQKYLNKAKYEYDAEAKLWTGFVPSMKLVYAQAPTIDGAREELSLTIEEYLLANIANHKKVTGFNFDFDLVKAYA